MPKMEKNGNKGRFYYEKWKRYAMLFVKMWGSPFSLAQQRIALGTQAKWSALTTNEKHNIFTNDLIVSIFCQN